MDVKKLMENLERRHIHARYFETGEEAVRALSGEITGKRVAFGGSVTLKELGLYEALSGSNQVYWHWIERSPEQRQIECDTQVYILSANGVAETGELVNIDGTGNRVANAIYGKEAVYYVFGVNKIEHDLHAAIDRARNVASPLNAKRLDCQTPCKADGDCHDCQSPGRICNVMSIVMEKTGGVQRCEAIIIGQSLGY